MNSAPEIRGANQIVQRFGGWPAFHDAEVVSIAFHRDRGCVVVLSSEGNRDLVTFTLTGFPLDEQGSTKADLGYFNHQNVLSGLNIDRTSQGWLLTLDSIFGVSACIHCEQLSVELETATPER